MKLKNTYFILRHGENTYLVEKPDFAYPKYDNRTIKLTKKGVDQIKTALEKIRKIGIGAIYSSDFFRTRQTAEIVANGLGLKINFDKRLRDVNLGVFFGRPKKELYAEFLNPLERFIRRPKNGENWNDLGKRMIDFLKDTDKKHRGKKILIVGHGDPFWLLEGSLRGLNRKELLKKKFTKEDYIRVGELRKL